MFINISAIHKGQYFGLHTCYNLTLIYFSVMIFKNNEVKKRLDFYNFTFKIAGFQEDICKANLLSDSSQKYSSVHEK